MTANDDEATRNEAITPGASPICASRSKGMSCWMSFGKLRISPRGRNKNARGR